MGVLDGPVPVCCASHVGSSTALYCSLLWLYRHDHLLRHWGTYHGDIDLPQTLLTLDLAPLYNSDPSFGCDPAGRLALVHGQLLPNGKHWIAFRCQSRRRQSRGVDEQLTARTQLGLFPIYQTREGNTLPD